MTNEELIARLRNGCNLQQRDGERAADRIEALIAEREKATLWAIEQHALADNYALRISQEKAKLAKAVELLEEIAISLARISGFFVDTFPRKEIKATLAEIKGESHE
jgi:hypothetical protein